MTVMSSTISIGNWLDVIEDEYLGSYIKDGGTAVKFAVADASLREQLSREMERRCGKSNFLLLKLDARAVRAHMPQEIFFRLARQLDWPELARRVVLRSADEADYDVGGIDPVIDRDIIEAVASANALEPRYVLSDLRREIQETVAKSPDMLRDFRVGMRELCIQRNVTGDHPVVAWLTGVARVSIVREFLIYTRIDRTTARYFIESTLSWIRLAGYAGTVLILDNSRVTVARNPKDGHIYYTKAMTVDHYEMLREFVDDIDRLPGMLLLVATNRGFLERGARSRGFGIYEALRTRVMDDVRDRKLVNPVASLVRLA